jgi:hypothetical protein
VGGAGARSTWNGGVHARVELACMHAVERNESDPKEEAKRRAGVLGGGFERGQAGKGGQRRKWEQRHKQGPRCKQEHRGHKQGKPVAAPWANVHCIACRACPALIATSSSETCLAPWELAKASGTNKLLGAG